MLRTEEKLSVQVGFLDEIIVSNGDKSLAAYTHQGIVLQHLTPYCTTSNLYSKIYTFIMDSYLVGRYNSRETLENNRILEDRKASIGTGNIW